MESRKIRTALVDDHPLFRAGLGVTLGRDAEVVIAGEAGNAHEALELAQTVVLDIVIVDVLMPSVSGISLTARLKELQPDCKILGLSVIDEPLLIADMLRAGAGGYALKTQPIDEIIEAIHSVVGGVRYLPPRVSRDAVEHELEGTPWRPIERLTPREREVFELLIRGYSNDEISSQLFIARRTVETHRQRVMNKLSARSIVEMIRIAARHGGFGE